MVFGRLYVILYTSYNSMQEQVSEISVRQMPKKLSKTLWFVLLVLVVVFSMVGYFFRDRFFTLNGRNSSYQAVFLTNGQVYFGSISNVNDNYVVLRNIYYLQQATGSPQGSAQQSQPFTLVKLGKEFHGPADVMYINRSQILFYEDLRSDSNVVKTIESSQV